MKRWSTASVGLFVFAFALVFLHWSSIPARALGEGKRLTILVGVPPAGGHDLEARVIARHLHRYLPGSPSIVVQNMPGAGGAVMATYLYGRGKPDGLTFGVIGRPAMLTRALRREEVRYDPARMAAVFGAHNAAVDLARDFLGARTAQDLLKVDPSQIVIGGRSPTDSSCLSGKLGLDLLGITGYKAVCAYPGTAVIKGAMERGEVSFFNAIDSHLVAGGAFAEMADKGLVHPLWQHGFLTLGGEIVRSALLPRVPTFEEVYRETRGTRPSGVRWQALKAISNLVIQRAYLLPPGVPPDRVSALRQAFDRMAQDPAFVAEWERVFGQKFAPGHVPTELVERMKSEFLEPAPWQEFVVKELVKR